MGKQYRTTRTLGVYPITAGGFITVDLPRQYDLEALHVTLDAVVQVTAAATSVKSYAPCQLLPRVELVADGKNTVYSGSLLLARIGNQARGLTQGNAAVAPSGTAVASYTVGATATIDLQSADTVRPKDTNFRTSGLQLWQARFSIGQAGDMFQGGTAALTSGTITLTVDECVELPDAAGGYSMPAFMKRVSTQSVTFAGAQSNFDFRLPAGNLIRDVSVYAADANGSALNNTLTNLKLAAGLDVRFACSGSQARMRQFAEFGAQVTGLFMMDFCAQSPAFGQVGNLSNLWDVTGSVEPKLTVDVSSACVLEVRTTELIRL